jgi:hypothetical protein
VVACQLARDVDGSDRVTPRTHGSTMKYTTAVLTRSITNGIPTAAAIFPEADDSSLGSRKPFAGPEPADSEVAELLTGELGIGGTGIVQPFGPTDPHISSVVSEQCVPTATEVADTFSI